MITLDQAREHVGSKVVYRAPHISRNEAGEEGVITSVNAYFVFVRYGSDTSGKATAPEDLEMVSAQPQEDT